jgi:hypothetical protein
VGFLRSSHNEEVAKFRNASDLGFGGVNWNHVTQGFKYQITYLLRQTTNSGTSGLLSQAYLISDIYCIICIYVHAGPVFSEWLAEGTQLN